MNIHIYLVDEDLTLKYKVIQFSGGERHIQFENLPPIIDSNIQITAHLMSTNDVFDLILLYEALEANIKNYRSLILTIPYMPYARQDRRCAPGQAHSLEVFATLIETFISPDELITWDMHSNAGLKTLKECMPNTHITNIEQCDIIGQHGNFPQFLNNDDSVLISPDKGTIEKIFAIRNNLCKRTPILTCLKERNPETGEIVRSYIQEDETFALVKADPERTTAIICDDICDGGYTFIKIAELLRAEGFTKIVLYVTHGIFSKGLEPFGKLIDLIYCSDSIPNPNMKYRTDNLYRIL